MENASVVANDEVTSTTPGTSERARTTLGTWPTSVANRRSSQTHEEVESTRTQGPLSERTRHLGSAPTHIQRSQGEGIEERKEALTHLCFGLCGDQVF